MKFAYNFLCIKKEFYVYVMTVSIFEWHLTCIMPEIFIFRMIYEGKTKNYLLLALY